MPSREYRERALARAAEARDITINISLQPYNTTFQVKKTQLAVLAYFAVYLASLGRNSPLIQLDGFHPVIFNIAAQWLLSSRVWPLRDNSLNTGIPSTIGPLSAVDMLSICLQNIASR
ncbi:hypothetical protein CC86DRAFT_406404 [Ophiobolus disseminans]|uniref:Uncharacterized protein n=1 Tax=Ophiobolus disseminans TaxID=1469910 RepID=A0A6A7A0N1_9PLEO|nr:hypothetical protein CC86DRAFT_406404 [Ophiobolus disseminans]